MARMRSRQKTRFLAKKRAQTIHSRKLPLHFLECHATDARA